MWKQADGYRRVRFRIAEPEGRRCFAGAKCRQIRKAGVISNPNHTNTTILVPLVVSHRDFELTIGVEVFDQGFHDFIGDHVGIDLKSLIRYR